MKKAVQIVFRVLGLILVFALCLLAFMALIPLTESADKTPVPGSSDWMASLDDELPLNRIVLPGTHDSATQYVQLAFFSKCQALSISGQLEAGFRYLDIRLGIGDDGAFQLMHGFTRCKTGAFGGTLYLEELLRQCYTFLDDHPGEAILFAVKQEHGDQSAAEFETALDAVIRENPQYWLLTDTMPTLGESRGKLVLLRRYEDEAQLADRAGIPLLWKNQNGYDNPSLHAAEENNPGYTLWVQDRYEYNTAEKWTAFLAGLSSGNTDGCNVKLSFLSTKGTMTYGHPYRFAGKLNQELLTLAPEELSGWIVLDFASPKLASHIYEANF